MSVPPDRMNTVLPGLPDGLPTVRPMPEVPSFTLPDRQQLTIEALRGQPVAQGPSRSEKLGLLAQLTGDRALSPVGKSLYSAGANKRKLLQQSLEKRRQQQQTEDYYRMQGQQMEYNALMKQRQQELDQEKAYLKYLADMEKAQAKASEKSEPKPLLKPTTKDLNEVVSGNQMYNDMKGLIDRFEDSYSKFAWVPGMNDEAVAFYNKSGLGSKNLEEAANWWSEFRRVYDLLKRNDLFGATLTALEDEAWKGTTINENLPPDEVKRRLKQMTTAMENERQAKANAWRTMRNPEFADVVLGKPPKPPKPEGLSDEDYQEWLKLKGYE